VGSFGEDVGLWRAIELPFSAAGFPAGFVQGRELAGRGSAGQWAFMQSRRPAA